MDAHAKLVRMTTKKPVLLPRDLRIKIPKRPVIREYCKSRTDARGIENTIARRRDIRSLSIKRSVEWFAGLSELLVTVACTVLCLEILHNIDVEWLSGLAADLCNVLYHS